MVVFSDYFSAILGFVRKGISWSLDPFQEIRKEDHTFVERGQGNAVSVEVSSVDTLVYGLDPQHVRTSSTVYTDGMQQRQWKTRNGLVVLSVNSLAI